MGAEQIQRLFGKGTLSTNLQRDNLLMRQRWKCEYCDTRGTSLHVQCEKTRVPVVQRRENKTNSSHCI